jgi:hypothetical protein
MSNNPIREYLGLELGKIGEPLPKDFKFASQKTMNAIIGKINSDMLGKKWVGNQTNKKKVKLEGVIDKVPNENNDEQKFYKNLTNLCIKIPFDDNYHQKEKGNGTVPHQIYNLAPTFTTKSKDNKEKLKQVQYIIGRVDSISNFNGYTLKKFRTLFLNGATFHWTPFVNDLFITCSYAYAKFHQFKNPEIAATSTNNNTLIFPIMLVMAKSCVTEAQTEDCVGESEDCVEHPQVFLKSTIDTDTLNKVMKIQEESGTKDPDKTCVFSGISDNKTKYPSVTFRELVILADILGMDVYKLKTPKSFDLNTDDFYIYYFSLPTKDKESFQKSINEFNNNQDNKNAGFRLIKIQIKWARTANQSGGYYNEYMEYKQKYMVLKKIKKE